MEGKSSNPNPKLLQRLQTEFAFNPDHIQNTLSLLLADNTIPFVARYRKEQTGNLDEMFTSVSAYYEEEFDTAVENMSSLIEPIMIVFMGTMIGGLMIAMYSPIFNVGAIIGQ